MREAAEEMLNLNNPEIPLPKDPRDQTRVAYYILQCKPKKLLALLDSYEQLKGIVDALEISLNHPENDDHFTEMENRLNALKQT
jgi:Rad3-related DNA helicase